jgi:hypothetical protein
MEIRAGYVPVCRSDQHGLLLPAARPGWVFAANDGGLDLYQVRPTVKP